MENTANSIINSLEKKDHLHIRGEYFSLSSLMNLISGSSPHTWRILSQSIEVIYVVKDHLHIRGEYETSIDPCEAFPGSSPHTWRILLNDVRILIAYRIISTYVENTKYLFNCSNVM